MTKQEFINRCREKGSPDTKVSFAIAALDAYRNEFLFEPGINWPEIEFYTRSIGMWVIDELGKEIRKHPDADPVTTAERFYDNVNELIWQAESTGRRYFYEAAADFASDITNYLHVVCG